MEPLYVAYLSIAMAAATVTLARALPTVIEHLGRRRDVLRRRRCKLVRARSLLMERRGRMAALLIPYYRQRVGPDAFALTCGDVTIPLLAKSSWLPTRPLPLSAVTLGWHRPGGDDPVLDRSLAQRLRSQCNAMIDNRPTYRLLAVSGPPDEPVLDFSLSSYEHYVGTGEALAVELALALLPISPDRWTDQTISRLTEKKRLLPYRKSADEFDLTTRSVPPGIVTLTIVVGRSAETTVFLVHRRSTLLAEHPDGYSMVPAGTFQPLSLNDAFHAVEFSLARNIIREFGEELLNKEQLIASHGAIDPDQPFRTDDDLRHLWQVFEHGLARIFYLGCTLDVVTLKPEVLTLLLVRADALTERWDSLFNGWEGNYEIVTFDEDSLRQWLSHPGMATAGQGCIAVCLRHYETVRQEIDSLCSAVRTRPVPG